MSQEFKIGDRIRFIEQGVSSNRYTVGNIYTVTQNRHTNDNPNVVSSTDDTGIPNSWHSHFFELVNPDLNIKETADKTLLKRINLGLESLNELLSRSDKKEYYKLDLDNLNLIKKESI